MAKVTIEFTDIEEARTVLDVLSDKSKDIVKSEEPTSVDEDALDVHGMKWDEAIHSSSREKNADGAWKAQRGKKKECDASVAAFKASGGNVTPPSQDTLQLAQDAKAGNVAPAMGMPGSPPPQSGVAPAMGMPGSPPPQEVKDAPPPVSYDTIRDKVGSMMKRGTLTMDNRAVIGGASEGTYEHLLDKFGIDRAQPHLALEVNETLRASFYEECLRLDPQ